MRTCRGGVVVHGSARRDARAPRRHPWRALGGRGELWVSNVDYVVVIPQGCLAVEVKSSFSRRQKLAKGSDLAGKVAQARDGAQRVEKLLRSRGVDLPVRPVLLFTGPGAPF